jgi:hypothetical protein
MFYTNVKPTIGESLSDDITKEFQAKINGSEIVLLTNSTVYESLQLAAIE